MNAKQINGIEYRCKQYQHYKMKIKNGRIEIISEINTFTSNFLNNLIQLQLDFTIENNTIYIYDIDNE